MLSSCYVRALAPVALLAAATPALADFITPDAYGWSRGDADSAYFEWDFFTSGSGNEPDVGQFPDPLPAGWATPDVAEITGNGFATGSGNIYSPFGPMVFEITVPNYGYGAGETTLLLQLRTVGTELDYGAVTLDGAAPDEVIELGRESTDMGFRVETLFVFGVSGNADEYVFTAPTVEAHLSLERVAVDTSTGSSCAADFNADGSVDTRDVIAFLNAWSAGESSADSNGDGVVDTRDVILFLNLWTAGC
ncbi:MAG TPA: GC-type dockerin domain-anchored protein [Phycisphaerales bacterium]|nr:GC-type dockerin domain-anchored protein [Phycisphaerales bacterium]